MTGEVVQLNRVRQRRQARSQIRSPGGEFHSSRSLQEKLRIVRAVAEAAVEQFPAECRSSRRVQQRFWNSCRNLLESKHGRIPQANELVRQIRVELREPRVNWRLVLELAHMPEPNLTHLLKSLGRPDTGPPPPSVIAFAILAVARFLGVTTLSPLDYDRGREEFVRSRRRTASRDYYMRRSLPTSNSIITAAGTWPDALTLAGLQHQTPLEAQDRGVRVPIAIALYFAETGGRPGSRKALESFAKQQGFSLQKLTGRDWPTWWALGREEILRHPELRDHLRRVEADDQD